jgi:hypothetical protein
MFLFKVLCNDVVGISDLESSDRVINDNELERNMEGRGRGLI